MKEITVAVYGAADQALIRQFPNRKGKWGNCKFIINEHCDYCDYLFMIDSIKTDLQINCPKENTYLCICEPAAVKLYSPQYTNQFRHIITFRNVSGYTGEQIYDLPMLPWRIGSRYDKIKKCSDMINYLDYDFLSKRITSPKLNKIAIITSSKTMTNGHRKRLKLLKALKNEIPEYIDIYGNGFQFIEDKWDVFSKYKYVLTFENCQESQYITEKIFDAYIAEALPLYWGAPDIERYFPKESYEIMTFKDIKETAQHITKLLFNNTYDERLPFILEAKKKVMNEYNIFFRIATMVENVEKQNTVPKTHELYTIEQEHANFPHKLKQKFYRFFK